MHIPFVTKFGAITFRMVKFINHDRKLTIPQKKKIKGLIESVFRKEKQRLGTLQYIFCSDDYLLQVNRDFLKHDHYTDIITFDLSSDEATEAEIYISLDRVKENALSFSQSYYKELLRVITHGALHLCGYKDKTSSDKKEMRKMEDRYLRLYEKSLSK
jgi:rRNA maturation RNase YbeY